MGGLYTGGLVILCLAFLMPYCAFIPKVRAEIGYQEPSWGSFLDELLSLSLIPKHIF